MSDPARESERRVVTILFCDVADSVQLAAQVDAETWTEIMDQAFDSMTRPVRRYEGTVARLMGDGMLALFGAPIAHEEDPQRAVLAALEIQQGVQGLAQELERDFGMQFRIRIGIHTGPVVVGEIGSEVRKEYTVMGDAANLAARMEQTAQPGTIQISADTYRLVAPLFETTPLESVPIKGKSAPVNAYRVDASKAQSSDPRQRGGLRAPLVGRETHLATLKRTLEELRLGRGGLVLILGEAGLGKSRLLYELRREWVRASAGGTVGRRSRGIHATWTESHGVSYDQMRPYSLFLQRVRRYLGVEEGDSPDLIQHKISQVTSELPTQQREGLTEAVQVLLAVGGERESSPPEAEALKRELQEALAQDWREAATSDPIVVVFDDLQWADAASIDLLLNSLHLTDEVPILFLCASRPNRDSPGWKVKQEGERSFHHRYLEINLKPLTEQQSAEMVTALAGNDEVPPELLRRIQGKAEGNPFFLEEIIRSLIRHGHMTPGASPDLWRQTSQTEEIAIPETLQALLASRIDGLDADARRTLQIAAVIGRTFRQPVLAKVLGNGMVIDRELNKLLRAELIDEAVKGPEAEYAFRHELLREAAYGSILRRRLRDHHRLVAEAIEQVYPELVADYADRLAYHYDRAGESAQAIEYYLMAGDAAARLYANPEALAKYGRAIELAHPLHTDRTRLLRLYLGRGRALELTARFDEALADYQALEQLGDERGDPGLSLAGTGARAIVFSTPTARFNARLARNLGERALALAKELSDPAAEAKALWGLMLVEYFIGENPQKGVSLGEASLALAARHDIQDQLPFTLHDLARTYEKARRVEDSIATNSKARELWRARGNRAMLADNLTSAAFTEFLAGRLEQAEALAEEAHSISLAIDNMWGRAFSRMRLGPIAIERGNLDRGLECMLECLGLADKSGFAAAKITVSGLLALVYGMLGRPDRGFRLLEQYDVVNDRSYGPMEDMSRVYAIRAQLYLRSGDLTQARATYARAMSESEGADLDYLYGPIFNAIGLELHLAACEFESVLAQSHDRMEVLRTSGMRLFMPDVLRCRALALCELGQEATALETLAEAQQIAEEIGSRRALLPIYAARGEMLDRLGDQQGAVVMRGEAQRVLALMLKHLTEPDLRSTFQELPLRQKAQGT